MKKIELHCHFDGSINAKYASNLLGYNVLDRMPKIYNSLSSYLEEFSLLLPLLQSRENLITFSSMLADDLEKDEVIYAEIRFCPLFHTSILTKYEVIDAVLCGLRKNKHVKINLILCMMRQFDEEKNKSIIDLALEYKNRGVVAIDLAGDETSYPTINYASLFAYAKSMGITYTIHAGEAGTYKDVDAAISFGSKRVGHGIKAIDSDNTIKSLIENHVTLEVCPKSNLDTKVCHEISKHPIKKLMDLGVKVTVNTDNRTVSRTTLENEYNLLKNFLGFTDNDLKKLNENAIDAAFITKEEKEQLRSLL